MPIIVVVTIVKGSRTNYEKRVERQAELGLIGMPWAFPEAKNPEGIPFEGDLVLFVFPKKEDRSLFQFSIERVVTSCRELAAKAEAFEGFRWQFESEVFNLPDGDSSQYELEQESGESKEAFQARGISEAKKALGKVLNLEPDSDELDSVFREAKNSDMYQSYMKGGRGVTQPAVFGYNPDSNKYQRFARSSSQSATVSPKLRNQRSEEMMSVMDELEIESLLLLH